VLFAQCIRRLFGHSLDTVLNQGSPRLQTCWKRWVLSNTDGDGG